MSDQPRTFDQIVFSGGGTRCFWQGGFMEVARSALTPAPKRIAGVSGGALSAACFIADRERDLLEIMASAFAGQDSNISWDAVDPDTGLTPHQRIYRRVVSEALNDAAQSRVDEGPAFQVLLAHPPARMAQKAGGTLAALVYEAELHLLSAPHLNWAERFGLSTSFIDGRQAARDGRLRDLVCAAATIPPLFDLPAWDGRKTIDGGMADQAPMPDPDDGHTLILLTRDYRNVPDIANRSYVRPSEETPADKIDFTDPEKIRRTWKQGEADAQAYLEKHIGNKP